MKLFKKMLVGVAAAAALATSAQAAPITVGGVTWDPSYALDLSGFSSRIRQFADNNGTLSGYGYIFEMNNSAMLGGVHQLMPVGQELTYQFGGFALDAGSVTPTATGQAASYTGGWLKVFADNGSGGTLQVTPNDIFSYNSTNTGDGLLWLDLVGHPILGLTLTVLSAPSGGSGSSSFDVIGGAAASNLNTSQLADGADINFNSSFSLLRGTPNPYTDMIGNGNFIGNSVPEPESLALVGLGILALAASRRRKSV
jgi:hypothetical protein